MRIEERIRQTTEASQSPARGHFFGRAQNIGLMDIGVTFGVTCAQHLSETNLPAKKSDRKSRTSSQWHAETRIFDTKTITTKGCGDEAAMRDQMKRLSSGRAAPPTSALPAGHRFFPSNVYGYAGSTIRVTIAQPEDGKFAQLKTQHRRCIALQSDTLRGFFEGEAATYRRRDALKRCESGKRLRQMSPRVALNSCVYFAWESGGVGAG